MKKFLISTLVAASVASCMGAFVACGNDSNNDADTAKKAIATVRTLYEGKAETIEDSSYQVIGQTKANEKTCTIKWSVESEFENWGNYIVVGNPDPDDGNKVTISLTRAQGQEISFTLKATVTVGKASESASFNRKIPAGQAGENQTEVTINFAGQATSGVRTVFTSAQQVWTQNGVTLTNDKGASTTAVDNATSEYHVRLYKSSSVKIEYPGMTKLVFHSDSKQGSNDYHAYLKATLEATGLGTVTADADNLTVTLELVSPMNVLEFAATGGQIRLTSLDVVANKTPATDKDKVNGAKAALDLTVKSFVATGTYDLPTEKLGATVTWAVTSDYAEIENGKLKITSMPTSETEVTLTATIKVNDETATKDITITLVPLGLENDGTAEHPYTTTEAIKVAKLLAVGATDDKEVYVKGYVIAPGTYNSDYNNFDNMYIAETYAADKDTTAEDAFYVFRPKAEGSYLTAAGLNKGDFVTFKGNLQNYKEDVQELVNGVCVAKEEPDRTDDEIVELAKSKVDLAKKTYTAIDTTGVELPTTNSGATLAWEVVGAPSEYATIEGGKLKITKLPTSGDATVQIKVTISYKTATPQTKTIDLTLKAPATAPVGTFKYGVAQETIGKKLYFKGTINNDGFAETTEDVSEAVDVVIAAATGGYTFKVGNKYLELYTNSSSKVRFQLVDTPSTTTAWVFDGELKVFTWTEGSKVYYVGAYSTFDTFSPSETKYIKTAGNFVAKFEDPASKTDEDKIDDALALVKAKLNNITEIGKVTLPTSTVDGVTFVWTLATDNNATCATVIQEDGAYKLNVTAIPEDADATVKLVVTASCGDATDKTKSVSVVVEKLSNITYGTVDEPLSVTEAIGITDEQCKNKDDETKQVVTVKGIVKGKLTDKGNNNYEYKIQDLTDSSKVLTVYGRINLKTDVATPAENDTVIISGYIKNYNGTIEFVYLNSTNVYVESNVRGTSTITLTNNDENATVTGLPTTETNGETVTFTVTAKPGKTVTAVKVGGNAIDPTEANGNTYTFTVEGNMTVVVESKNDDDEDPVELKTITFNSTNNSKGVSAYETSFDATQDGLAWEVKNFNNNNNGWNYIKGGHTSKALVSSITTKQAVQSKVTKVVVTIDAVTASNINSFKLLISNNADLSDATEVTVTIDQGDITFTVPTDAQGANKYYSVAIDCKVGKASVQVSKVVLWGFEDTTAPSDGDDESAPETQTLSLPEAIVDEQ